MKTLLNIIWLVFSGIWLAIAYVFFGIIACIFIITIPFGLAAFRMAGFALWPFGRTVIAKPSSGVGSGILNVIWFVIAGFWLALGHIGTAIAMAITIIGIPLAIGNIKMIPVTCFPFGKSIVPTGQVPAGAQVLYQS